MYIHSYRYQFPATYFIFQLLYRKSLNINEQLLTCLDAALSSPLVGSSNSITGGFVITSTAIDNRFLSPPLRFFAIVTKQSFKPSL